MPIVVPVAGFWTRQPGQWQPLDKRNPLAARANGFFTPYHGFAAPASSASATYRGKDGLGFQNVYHGNGWTLSATSKLSVNSTWTVLVFFGDVSSGATKCLVSERPSERQIVRLTIGEQTADKPCLVVRDPSSNLFQISGSTSVSGTGKSHVVCAVRYASNDHRLFVDGVQEATSTVNSSGFAEAPLLCADDSLDFFHLDSGGVFCVVTWPYALTPVEVERASRRVNAYPWRLLKRQNAKFFMLPASTALSDSVTEPVTAADAPTATLATTATRTEAATATDAPTATIATSATQTEALVGVGATEAATSGTSATQTEAATAADAAAASYGAVIAQTEPIVSLAAQQDAVRDTAATQTEDTTAADTASATSSAGGSVTEALATVGSTQTAVANLFASITEAVTATDAPTASAALLAAITEAVAAVSAETTPGVTLPPKYVSPLLVGVPMSMNLRMVLLLADQLNAADSVAEPVSVSDVPNATAQRLATVTEALATVGSTQTATAAYSASIVEAATATDSSNGLSSAASVNESVTATDTTTALSAKFASITEGVTATDTVSSGSLNYDVDITESVSAQDAVSATSSAGGDNSDILAAIAVLQAQITELTMLVRNLGNVPQIVGLDPPERYRDAPRKKTVDDDKKARIAANNALIMQMVRDTISKGTPQ